MTFTHLSSDGNMELRDAIIATAPFMSRAPRPQTQPSASSPEKGGKRHPAGSAGTTSAWP